MAKSYIPSHKRVKNPPPMRLTERDQEIILAVHEYRLLSSQHVEVLFFPSNKSNSHSRRSACQRRLQLLFHHSYLDRLSLPLIMGEGRSPFVYALGKAGATLVASRLNIDREKIGWKPKVNQLGAMFIDHSLAINDVQVVVNLLAGHSVWEVVSWIDESTLRSPDRKEQMPSYIKNGRLSPIYPDGYFAIKLESSAQPAHFFLEVDRATMSNYRWQEKVRAYNHFRGSGLSQHYYGTENFRILAITTGRERLANLKRATEDAGGDVYFWFTTQEHVDLWCPEKLIQPVWTVASKETLYTLLT